MKPRSIAGVVLFFLASLCLKAQNLAYQSYTWEASPKLHDLTGAEKKENSVNIKLLRSFEYAFVESRELVMYVTVHIIVKVNNEKGVEAKNKVYISRAGVLEEMDLKARVIDKNGKVIPLDKAGVKKIDNYENAGPFTIFALEGVEPGCEIEYLYTNKETPDLSKSLFCQYEYTCKDQDISVISPSNLVFEAKGYNGWPEFKKDTTLADKNKIYSHSDLSPALHEERYSFYNASRMRCDYKLAYNYAKDRSRLYTWEDAGVRFYGNLFSFSKKEISATATFIKKSKLKEIGTEEEKVKALDNLIKNTVAAQEGGNGDEYFLIDKILSNKYAGPTGIVRLYLAALKEMQIPAELVLTCDKNQRKFDKEFDSWSFLQEYLLFFPGTGKFLSPSELNSRLGYPPAEFIAQKGLFIKEVMIGDVFSGVVKIKEIPAPDYTASMHSTFVDVNFDPANLSEPGIQLKESFTGYSAYFYQPVYTKLNEEQKLELNEALLKVTGEDSKVTNVKAFNYENPDIFVKPFELTCTVSSPTLMGKAGDKYLFKAGLLIGAQAELYQEGQRQTPAEMDYAHGFYREIKFNIPDGYKLTNPGDINLESVCNINGELKARFKSEYEITGNAVKIKVYEDYRAMYYPLAVFEDFRKVINAAADFNKVTLIFEKIK
jgi:hypothetical protein